MELNGKEVGAVQAEGLTAEVLEKIPVLGNLTWFNLCEVEITKEDIEDLFTSIGIDEKFMPQAIKPENAFKRATSLMNKQWRNKSVPIDGEDGKYYTFMVRDVASKMGKIVRHVVAEVRDETNEQLSYKDVGKFVYKHSNQQMEVSTEPGWESVVSEAQTTFANKLKFYENAHVRQIVLNMLNSTDPISVRPTGGVFFVPDGGSQVLGQMGEFIEALNDYAPADVATPASLDSVLVMDVEQQRKMISNRFDAQVQTDADKMIAEMAEFLTDEKKVVKKATLQRFLSGYNDTKDAVKTYEELLKKDMTFATTQLDLMKHQLNKLISEANVSLN